MLFRSHERMGSARPVRSVNPNAEFTYASAAASHCGPADRERPRAERVTAVPKSSANTRIVARTTPCARSSVSSVIVLWSGCAKAGRDADSVTHTSAAIDRTRCRRNDTATTDSAAPPTRSRRRPRATRRRRCGHAAAARMRPASERVRSHHRSRQTPRQSRRAPPLVPVRCPR